MTGVVYFVTALPTGTRHVALRHGRDIYYYHLSLAVTVSPWQFNLLFLPASVHNGNRQYATSPHTCVGLIVLFAPCMQMMISAFGRLSNMYFHAAALVVDL